MNFEQEVESRDLYDGDWPGFVELCKSYLRFCRDVDPDDMMGSFDLFSQFYTDLATAFSNNRGAVLQTSVVVSGKIVTALALSLDSQDKDDISMIRTSYISSLFLKVFNSIRGEKVVEDDPLSKKAIILFVATILCRMYFKLKQPTSCANVFSNIHTANIKFSEYSMAHRVEYRYYLGRFYLLKNQLLQAHKHLNWSFDNCMNESNNKVLILQYLIPCSMLLGRLPTRQLLELSGLNEVYGPLVKALKNANYTQFMNHLDREPYKQWFLNRCLYVLLRSRSPVLLYRMIVDKIYKLQGMDTTLKFEDIHRAILVADTTSDVDLRHDPDHQELENICITLISQGFVKANIFTRAKVLKLRNTDPIPLFSQVHNINSQLQPNERWLLT